MENSKIAMANPTLPQNAYPVLRVSVEHFMRSIDLLGQIQNDNLVRGMIFIAMWNANVGSFSARENVNKTSTVPDEERLPIGVRELSRNLNLPYETVRRHVHYLQHARQCMKVDGGFIVPLSALRRRQTAAVLRNFYVNAIRLLKDLERIGFVDSHGNVRILDRAIDGELSDTNFTIVRLLIAVLLRALKITSGFWEDDIVTGLVFNAIWTANIKHITNTELVSVRAVISDSDRKPVSVLAVANSLRVPYETTRRHANDLVRRGACVRVGSEGLIVPAEFHRGAAAMTHAVYEIAVDFIDRLKGAGLKIDRL
jgi:DNA-binding transcriptional regulator YhcF (GntR family)